MKQLSPSDAEKRILDMLSRKLMSVSQVAKELGMRRDVATGFLEALRHQGKLTLHRVGRSNVYMAAKKR
jgi:transposase